MGDIQVLRGKAKVGRNPRLTMHHEEDIKRAFQFPPEESGIVANLWDGKTLSHYIESRYHIVLGVRQCQRLFKNLGFSLKRARPAVAKADAVKKEASKKFQEKIEPSDYEVYFKDECHFKQTLSIMRSWHLKGSHPEIKSPVDRHKTSIFGAMGMNGQLITAQSEVFDAETFLQFLKAFTTRAEAGLNRDGQKRKLLMVLDNARYHHAKLLKPWLESMSDRWNYSFCLHIRPI